MRDLELAVFEDGTALATVAPDHAPPGQRMLLGKADGAIHFLVIEDVALGAAGDGAAASSAGHDFRALRTIATSLDPTQASLAVHAVALAQWHDRHSCCAVCGTRTEVAMSGESRRCPNCGAQHFPRTDPAVIMLVVDDEDRCLLGHNAARDATWYSTLAGFVEPGESLGGRGRTRGRRGDRRRRRPGHLRRQPAVAVPVVADARLPGACGRHRRSPSTAWRSPRLAGSLATSCAARSRPGELVIPSTISISGALVQSWYGAALPVRSD